MTFTARKIDSDGRGIAGALESLPPRLSDHLPFYFIRGNPDECWEWLGNVINGYGRVAARQGKRKFNLMAHRAVFVMDGGSIPTGVVTDHLCRNKTCVNPKHVELVTIRENTMRGNGPGAVAVRTGKCRRGHEFDGMEKGGSHRTCTQCRRIYGINRRDRRRAAKEKAS